MTYRPGEVDAGDARFFGLPPAVAAALADAHAAAARRRRARWIAAATHVATFLAGLAAGLLWSI